MTISLSPNESDVLTALRAFLLAVLPDGVDAIKGQDNRVGEPPASDYVVMWPIMRPRLATNVDDTVDTVFTGSIAGAVLAVSAFAAGSQGAVRAGAALFGVGLAANTTIGDQISGPAGGVGTYAVAPSQTVAGKTMAAGQTQATQETEVVVQIDVHSADLARAGDMAQIIATRFRDPFAAEISPVSRLYADDPRQAPFINAEQQYETRWTVDVHLQANQTVSGIPQQFADAITAAVVDVQAAYP